MELARVPSMALHRTDRRKTTAESPDASLPVFARRTLFRGVIDVLWRFRRRVAAALALLVAAKMFAVLVPVALKRIVDALGVSNEALVLPVFLLLAYALLRFLSGLFTELRDIVFARVTQTAVAGFTVRMLITCTAWPFSTWAAGRRACSRATCSAGRRAWVFCWARRCLPCCPR